MIKMKKPQSCVEEAMFDFFTLFNQDLETINLINERVSLELWAYALKGTNKDCRLYIINSMPLRVSTELKENLVRIGGGTSEPSGTSEKRHH